MSIKNVASVFKVESSVSNIPQGAGLGSSAGYAVAIADALRHFKWIAPNATFSKAKEIDDYFHSGSSGIDVFTCVTKGLCSYSSQTGYRSLDGKLLDRLRLFSWSLIDSKQRRILRDKKQYINPHALREFVPKARAIVEKFETALLADALFLDLLIECFGVFIFAHVIFVAF